MPRDLGFLPRRQLGVDDPKLPIGLVGQLLDLVGDVETARLAERLEFADFCFELGNGLFEVKEVTHPAVLGTAGRWGK